MKTENKQSVNILKVTKGQLDISGGDYYLYAFLIYNENRIEEHYALANFSNWNDNDIIPFRINSACLTSEVFGCQRCDCKWQLERAISYISEKGSGVITYHPNHEGLGHGIFEKLNSFKGLGEINRSYKEICSGEEDIRDFKPVKVILEYFNIKNVLLLGNNLRKRRFIDDCGVKVSEVFNLIYDGDIESINRYIDNKSRKPEHFELKKRHGS
ncbi:Riboflavin biosynthesis protein RibBA [Streptococcus sanguinis]|uniref:Riboflavin biosynthesis protein RibBA n=1 Tax=Streptococcus sanguinis TaxID=1305 RepID=A0AB74DQ09_STRSA|nr:hypothetical protein [Streptococcus sanguinis]RSI51779.1 Riboflavin biosynthesis protein RibBA [Streptococcus sanguinis]